MIGLALGVGLLVGALIGSRYARPAQPEIPLHALATHGTDTMAICTFPVSDGTEGLATLDFLTGELRLFVMNNRTYAFTLIGKTNVLVDLKIEKGKKLNLLMVPGATQFVRGGGALQPAGAALYVCDANSGAFVAYGMAYPGSALAAAVRSEIVIKRLDVGLARSLNLGE